MINILNQIEYNAIISVSDPDPDPDPVGSGYFDRLGSGSGLNTRILDPGSGFQQRF